MPDLFSLSVTYLMKHSSAVEALCVGLVLQNSICSTSPCMCLTYQILPHRMCGCILFPSSPKLTETTHPPTATFGRVWGRPVLLSWGLRWTLGYCPLIINLPGSTSTPGAGQTRNELSPLGWTAGWAVYGGGWALPSRGVNGLTRGAVSRQIHHIFWSENKLHAALLLRLGCLFLVSIRVTIWHRRCPFWWFSDLNLLTREGVCRIADKETGCGEKTLMLWRVALLAIPLDMH